jgi:XRE family transcriptional regulator, regulator of sulfur utilization
MPSAPQPTRVAFGRVVRKARRDRELSQESLAGLAGIGFKHLGEIERGRHDPRLTTALKLATALGLPLSELMARYEQRLEEEGS